MKRISKCITERFLERIVVAISGCFSESLQFLPTFRFFFGESFEQYHREFICILLWEFFQSGELFLKFLREFSRVFPEISGKIYQEVSLEILPGVSLEMIESIVLEILPSSFLGTPLLRGIIIIQLFSEILFLMKTTEEILWRLCANTSTRVS